MRVVDTSSWIEYLLGSDVGRRVADHLPDPQDWVVPTMVQFELAKWTTREAAPDRASGNVLAFTRDLNVVELTPEIAVRAAGVSRMQRLAAADAIIYATALATSADLLTCDAHFKDLPGVVYVPNSH